jgi:hypothetical protein
MRTHILLMGFVCAAAVSVTAPAMAQTSPATPPAGGDVSATGTAGVMPAPAPAATVEVKYREDWYGWQTLIADGVSQALLIGGSIAGSSPVADIGAAGYLFGAPIVHAVHGRVGWGAVSFGIRLGAPLVLSLVGLGVGCAAGGSGSGGIVGLGAGCAAGFAGGFLLGEGTAIALDAAVFGYEKVRIKGNTEDTVGQADQKKSWFTLQPSISLLPGHESVGVAGTF